MWPHVAIKQLAQICAHNIQYEHRHFTYQQARNGKNRI